ncbi:hypothetical protein M422DRAFT_272592 [Sphaerobolus stellatus SS14]|uniref:Uncharacterized protein n=1 Tax=Sphaerobolus stellatus (strain SS14) TaxID=990650 RepID=A0A0C9UB93_SPHS4|nr:hypothetical protein M422DRAFT_272592 [Sphaerobolus stellatus SS14]
MSFLPASSIILKSIVAVFPHGTAGCILAAEGAPFTPFYVMPLLTDSVLLILTIKRTDMWVAGVQRAPEVKVGTSKTSAEE